MDGSPARIGRYEIIEPLGQGGMGTVFLARDPQLDRRVAIKVLNANNDELRERFAREGRAAARLRHQNIVTVFDVGEHDGKPFLAMEFVDGTPLTSLVDAVLPPKLTEKLRIAEGVCAGLGFAHKAGIIHRDIKPGNISVASDGVVKILDFGIARGAHTEEMTMAGAVIGTLNYMSPEQISGRRVDHRSDIFAVGALCYELFSGERAFPGEFTNGLYNRIVNEPPVPLGEIVPGLDVDVIAIVDRALEKQPERRYQDLESMGAALARVRARLDSAQAESTAAATILMGSAPAANAAATIHLPPTRVPNTAAAAPTVHLPATAAPPEASPAASPQGAAVQPATPAAAQAPQPAQRTRRTWRTPVLAAAAVIAVAVAAYFVLAHRPQGGPPAQAATPVQSPSASAPTVEPAPAPSTGAPASPAPPPTSPEPPPVSSTPSASAARGGPPQTPAESQSGTPLKAATQPPPGEPGPAATAKPTRRITPECERLTELFGVSTDPKELAQLKQACAN